MYYFYNGIGEYYLYCIQVCFREIRSATSVLGCPACTPTEAVTVRPSTTHASSSSAATQPGPQMDRSIRVPDCSLLIIGMHASSSLAQSHPSHPSRILPNCVHIYYRFFFPNDKKEMSLGARKLSDVPCQIRALARTHVLAHVWNLSGEW